METRLRIDKRWFGADKVVLQIKETCKHMATDANDPKAGETFTVWRDATADDILNEKKMKVEL